MNPLSILIEIKSREFLKDIPTEELMNYWDNWDGCEMIRIRGRSIDEHWIYDELKSRGEDIIYG